jgi:hypothetical protein
MAATRGSLYLPRHGTQGEEEDGVYNMLYTRTGYKADIKRSHL